MMYTANVSVVISTAFIRVLSISSTPVVILTSNISYYNQMQQICITTTISCTPVVLLHLTLVTTNRCSRFVMLLLSAVLQLYPFENFISKIFVDIQIITQSTSFQLQKRCTYLPCTTNSSNSDEYQLFIQNVVINTTISSIVVVEQLYWSTASSSTFHWL